MARSFRDMDRFFFFGDPFFYFLGIVTMDILYRSYFKYILSKLVYGQTSPGRGSSIGFAIPLSWHGLSVTMHYQGKVPGFTFYGAE